MGLFDSSPSSSSSSNSAHGVNAVPAPRSDAAVNAPPAEQHKRVADFVREAPDAKYVFDSRRGGDNAEAELCRITPEGGKSCIKVTSLTSQPKVRQNIELLRRSLRALEIPYTEHDLVMDEDAKKLWQRSKPAGQIIGLPGYLVGGEWVGTMDDFEYAAETSTLPSFLKQDTDLAANQSVGEAELERLMREMSDADLDALALEVEKSEDKGSGSSAKVAEGASPSPSATATKAPAAASSNPLPALKDLNLTQDPIKGISSAAQSTIDAITQKAAELVSSLGGAEAHSGTADDRNTPSPSSLAFPSTPSATSDPTDATQPSRDPVILTASASGGEQGTTPPSATSPVGPGDSADRPRRMSKQEIAEKMMNANSVEGLLESLDMAEGKEKTKTD